VLIWDANESFGKLGGSATFDISLTDIQTGFPGGGAGGRMGGGMGGGQNELISRFLDSVTFTALYNEKLKLVYELAFESGAVVDMVEEYSGLIHSKNTERNLVDLDTYNQAVKKMIDFISQRIEFLKTQSLLIN